MKEARALLLLHAVYCVPVPGAQQTRPMPASQLHVRPSVVKVEIIVPGNKLVISNKKDGKVDTK